MKLADAFLESMREVIADKAEYEEFLAALRGQREYGLRVNTLKIDSSDFLRTSGIDGLSPVPWCGQGFYYDKQGQAPLGKHPLYNAGLYYIQEPSAMSAAAFLDAQPGDRVLDLCASPGGKTTQLAAALGGRGLLVSNDATFGRIPQLLRNVEMAGVRNAIVLCESPQKLATRFEGFFDRVLVDAPCSGEGMFRKDPAAITAWDESKPTRLATIQRGILNEAAKMVAGGGYLLYSTCTFNRLENEDVIEDFLRRHRDFELCGEPLRIWPHKDRGEGHFAARLRRRGEAEAKSLQKSFPKVKSDLFQDFCEKYELRLPEGDVFAHGDRLFVAPPIYPDLSGLRTIRAGLFLGTLKKQRFEPSYALALALKKSDFAQTIDLPLDSPLIAKFLGGESFEIDETDGYKLFCVQGYPIGFAKLLKGRLKGRII